MEERQTQSAETVSFGKHLVFAHLFIAMSSDEDQILSEVHAWN